MLGHLLLAEVALDPPVPQTVPRMMLRSSSSWLETGQRFLSGVGKGFL